MAARRVAFITEGTPGAPGLHGLSKLKDGLLAAGLEIETGSAPADLAILANVRSRCADTPRIAEALAIRRGTHNGKPAVILCGADSRGLMYAALDTADRVRWAAQPANPFEYVRDTSEKPYLAHRAVSMYTMQRAYFESRLYDETHWRRYFDMLAADRINSFTVIFGYENGGFMAPLYPYFSNVISLTSSSSQEWNSSESRLNSRRAIPPRSRPWSASPTSAEST